MARQIEAGPRHPVDDEPREDDRLASAINQTNSLQELKGQSFDYSAFNKKTADFLFGQADRIRQRLKRATSTIIEIGLDLPELKECLDHGQFARWIAAEFDLTDRTARNHMRAAEMFGGKTETVSVLPVRTLYKLAAKSTPEEVRAKVISMLFRFLSRALCRNAGR
jgi:Protein of unknown function (DUF3102)